jgi:hypothetical protein
MNVTGRGSAHRDTVLRVQRDERNTDAASHNSPMQYMAHAFQTQAFEILTAYFLLRIKEISVAISFLLCPGPGRLENPQSADAAFLVALNNTTSTLPLNQYPLIINLLTVFIIDLNLN